ncbi:hypothetical protein Glove_139g311 [Diversispora epigaea]|uniref:Uncharacterized protein n=1 Tax=Diversispora epigaea TaxID=1348612 RepID=A0A397J557_9GLOM|nr:hypothetical protein Glove_139g311 [Diversispora epigaea]
MVITITTTITTIAMIMARPRRPSFLTFSNNKTTSRPTSLSTSPFSASYSWMIPIVSSLTKQPTATISASDSSDTRRSSRIHSHHNFLL